MMELGVIFTIATSATETVTLAADLLDAVKRFIGEVDSLAEKVDRLLSSDLNAGFQHLNKPLGRIRSRIPFCATRGGISIRLSN
jgi:hypothetical protein